MIYCSEDHSGDCDDSSSVYCFDESDFIIQEEERNILDEEEDIESSSNENEKKRIDDYDDDDSSSSTSSGTERDEEELEALLEEGSVSTDEERPQTKKTEEVPQIEEDLDIQIIGIPSAPSSSHRSRVSKDQEARSLLPSEMEFSNAFALDSDDGEFVATSRERERIVRSSEAKLRAAMVQRLRSLVNLLRVRSISSNTIHNDCYCEVVDGLGDADRAASQSQGADHQPLPPQLDRVRRLDRSSGERHF